MADFSITALIGANVKDFQNGMADAKKSLSDFRRQAGESLGDISEAMGKTGKAMSVGITAPVVAGVTAAVKSYADLEQIVGGVSKLFGDSADDVIRNSESAYRRAGVSGVDYMEQVTSFSATLLAGLEGDTVKATEYADKAIVDMADNANTFGTNITDIQNAYQGFAKDNYSMLDNLKLGFGGTAGEMARLVNESGVMGDAFEATAENVKDIPFDQLIEAIHVTQNEMGITGTTAKEAAETVSGSFDSMKAAAQNLVAGLGDPNADVQVMFQVLGETVETFAGNVKRVLSTIWDNLPIADWQKWIGVAVVAAGPLLIVFSKLLAGVGSVSKAFSGSTTFMGGLAKLFPNITAGLKLVASGFKLLLGPIGIVIAVVAGLIAAFVDLYKNNEDFRNKINAIWEDIKGMFENFVNQIKEKIDALGIDFESFGDTLRGIWDKITAFLAPVFITAFDALATAIDVALIVILDLFDFFVAIFQGDWEAAWQKVVDIVNIVLDGLSKVFTDVMDLVYLGLLMAWNKIYELWETALSNIMDPTSESFKTILDNVQQAMESIWIIIQTIWDYIVGTFKNVVGIIRALMEGDFSKVREIVKKQMELIKTTISNLWEQTKQLFSNATEIIKVLVADAWSWIKDKTAEVWNAMKAYLATKWEEMKESARAIFDAVVDYFVGIWEDVKQSAIDVWEGIKTAVTDKINELKDGIKNAFKSGVQDPINDTWTNVQNKTTEIWVGIVSKLTEIWDSIKNMVSPYFESIGNYIGNVWENIKLITTNTWESIKAFFAGLLLVIVGLFTGDMELVKEAISKAWEMIKTNTLEIWEMIISNLTANWERIKTLVSDTWEKVKTTISEAWENVKTSTAEAWDNLVQNVTTKATELYENAVEKITSMRDNIILSIQNMVTTAINRVIEFKNDVIKWFETMRVVVPEKIKAMRDATVNWFINMKDKAIEAATNMKNIAVERAIQLKDNVVAKFNEMVTSVGKWVSELPAKVAQGFSDAIAKAKEFGSQALQAGRDLIMGFVNGVTEKARALIDAVGGAISGAIDWAKGLLGIHSPSRVFKQFGIFTDEGFADGIKKGAKGVKQSMGNMIGGAISEAESMTGSLNNALAASVSGNYAMSANGQLSINQQPAYINLTLGQNAYNVFVEDISNKQNASVQLDLAYL